MPFFYGNIMLLVWQLSQNTTMAYTKIVCIGHFRTGPLLISRSWKTMNHIMIPVTDSRTIHQLTKTCCLIHMLNFHNLTALKTVSREHFWLDQSIKSNKDLTGNTKICKKLNSILWWFKTFMALHSVTMEEIYSNIS